MDYPLDGCWTKLARATEHLQSLDAEIEAWLTDDPDLIQAELDRGTDVCTVRSYLPEPPLRWGATIGDIVHNLRSALDHLVTQLVIQNGHEPTRRNQFPMLRSKPDDFAARTRKMLEGVHPDHVAMVEELQPYQFALVDENELVILNDLSNTDKHRLINTVAFIQNPERQATQQLTTNRDIARIEEIQVMSNTRLEHGAEIARFRIVRAGPNPEVIIRGAFPVQVALEDGRNAIAELSDRIAGAVESIISRFIPVFGDWSVSPFYIEKDRSSMVISFKARGPRGKIGPVVTELASMLNGGHGLLRMRGPAKVLAGEDSIEAVVFDVDTQEAARMVLDAMFDQIPDGRKVLREVAE